MPLLRVNAPVFPAIDATEPADAMDEIVAYFSAFDAAESAIMILSVAAGLAFCVRAGMDISVAFAVEPVALPLIV